MNIVSRRLLRSAVVLAGLAVPTAFNWISTASRAEDAPAPIVLPSGGCISDLGGFRSIALEKQPSIAAARASLGAAVARSHAINSIRFGGTIFARDLPIRREQAACGIASYEAGIRVAEAETIYGVTFCYLANLYARQQEAVLTKAHGDLGDLHKLIKGFVDNEQNIKFVTKEDLSLIDAYMQTIDGHKLEATQGQERALAGLREAMGVGTECEVRPLLAKMPIAAINTCATREEVVALALARRGEIVMTSTFAHVSCLEITAQGRTFMPSLRTFASGSDIHAQVLPSSLFERGYRPGAVGPEMPTMLPGPRCGRLEQARNYHDRAEIVVEKTRNLITLEAEDAFLRWQEARAKAALLKRAAQQAEKYAGYTNRAYRDAAQSGFRVQDPAREPPAARILDVINAGAAAVRMKIDANRAYFEYLLALASLERVTAGGFCVEFYPAPEEPNGNGNGNGNGK